MRLSISLASVLALLAVVTLCGATSVYAQSQTAWTATGWVSSGALFDLTGNSNLASGQPLTAGHSYNMTLQINVPNTSTSTKTFAVSLNPRFGPAVGQSVYWALHTSQYPGYDRTLFTASEKTVDFNYTQGTLKLSAYFQVPVNFTIPIAKYSTPSGNGTITLHLPQNNVIFVSVVPALSTGTGSFSASVNDQTIQTYLSDYNQTATLVPSGKISSTFQTIVNSILAQAQALNTLGLPDNGTALLNTIVPSAFPVPPSGSLQTGLLVGLAGAVVVIVLLAVLMVRSRGKSGYSVGIINDVQKDLAVLEVTAAKYDRAMADKLKSLRDKLSESS
ncbi:MAG TPA: hypothetical protein VND41_02405 [Nitrososphaerales archaeon]|nr:hypothetical protein [Nitrososphaerales archaeon]